MRPPAAYCLTHPKSRIHGINIFETPYWQKVMDCMYCHHKVVRVDKSEMVGPSDVGYQFATQTIITEWP